MEPSRPKLGQEEVKAAFLQYVGADSTGDREVILAELEGQNPALASEVKSLLIAAGHADPLEQVFQLIATSERDSVNAGLGDTSSPTVERDSHCLGERVGVSIGPYKLLEQIGEGGMGTVYMAQQSAPIKRKVALKVVKPGTDTRHVIARFEAERQALALMDHPNIARVLDAGATEQGRPFFVMELVRGVPITDFCRREKLSRPAMLNLFLDVCRGVQHAHQKGIIHRDLKPSNVLVTLHDGKPVPKIIDFGVAKALNQDLTDSTLFTQYSHMIGTPLYMSPEQAELSGLDVDTRSDVYSLGVLLYEMLTGSTPLDRSAVRKASLDEVRRMIREDQPPRPSQRLSTLRAAHDSTQEVREPREQGHSRRKLERELDWVVMKPLEKERDRRYESVSAFAADIDRYLNDEAVEACPPSAWYRATKYVRRHRVMLATTAVVMVTILAGAGASVWQAIRATHAEQRAEERNHFARQVVDDMYSQVAEKWLSENGTLTAVQIEFLEKALAFYQQLPVDESADPLVQHETHRAQARVARMQSSLGRKDEAIETYEKLISSCRAHLGGPADDTMRPALVSDLVRAEASLGDLYRSLGLDSKANSLADAVWKDAQPLLEMDFADRDLDYEIALSLNALPQFLISSGRLPDAARVNERALRGWRSLLQLNPDSQRYRLGYVAAVTDQGALAWKGTVDRPQAEAVLRDAERELQRLNDETPGDKECRNLLVLVLDRLRLLFDANGQKHEALAICRRAIPLLEELVRDFPEEQNNLRSLIVFLQGADGLLMNNRPVDVAALAEVRQKWYIAAKTQLDRFPDYVYSQSIYVNCANWYAYFLKEQDRCDEARQVAGDAVQRVGRFTLLEVGGKELGRLIIDFSQLSALYAALEVQDGDYVRAAETLRDLPKKCQAYAGLASLPLPDDQSRSFQLSQFAWPLASYGHTLEECARKAEQDSRLDEAERSLRAEEYRERAAHFCREADLATSERVRAVAANPQFEENIFQEVAVEEPPACLGLRFAAPFERPFYRQFQLKQHRLMLEVAAKQIKDNPTRHWVVGILVAGPDDVRNPELALQLARQATEAWPDDRLAKIGLAWALCRAERWQECRDFVMNERHSLNSDFNCRAVLAMSLWHLGDREQAAWCINDKYVTALRSWLHKQPSGVYPSSEMYLNLDREARELLGLEPVDWSAEPPASESPTPPTTEGP